MKPRYRHPKNRGKCLAVFKVAALTVLAGGLLEIAHAQSPQSNSLAETGLRPAAVIWAHGQLTVRANNSELTQILGDVARQSGMTIEGTVREARVYGTYGPADPASVLSDLLQGMGYNVIIVGGSNGTDLKQLLLSSRTGVATPPSTSTTGASSDSSRPAQNAQQRTDEPPLPPGAIAHPQPSPTDDPAARRQQNMQNLMQRRAPLTNPATPP